MSPSSSDPQGQEDIPPSAPVIDLFARSVTDYAIIYLNVEGRITGWNTGAAQLFGYPEEEILGEHCRILFTPEDVIIHVPEQAIQTARERGRFHDAHWHLRKNGSRFWSEGSVQAVRDETGNAVGFAKVCRDISERRRHEQELQAARDRLIEKNIQLEALSVTDSLTGLKNHRAFQERLEMEMERANRYGTSLSVLMMDVDHFKSFNDTYGHPTGDAALRKVANVLAATARTIDFVARLGGEEFAAVLSETDAESATITAERFRAAIEAANWNERPVTTSFGVATLSATTPNAIDLLSEADAALYRSKWRGRNCVTHIADPLDIAEVVEEKRLEPYADMVLDMLDIQRDSLAAATERINKSLCQSYDTTVRSWSRIFGLQDRETQGHSERVTETTVRLARAAGMNEEGVLYVKWGALLHDIGKIGLPQSVLHNPGELTDEEWETVRRHPALGYELLAPILFLGPALDIPRYHHEKWDGSGYPSGLKGEEIPLSARLFTVVDVYDALRSDRPYRKAWPEEQVRKHLRIHAGTHFDPHAVRLFLSMLEGETAA